MFKEAHNENKKLIFGLIHLLPMPGTPFYKDGDLEKSVEKAIADAKALEEGGASGCLIQTVDRIYPTGDDTDYARVATMARIATEVKKVVKPDFKVGVQIMWNCITPSLAVCKAIGADFTRCTCLVGSTQSMFGGTVNADPLKIMEYRKKIEAENIDMIAEIAGYHFSNGYDKDTLLSLVRMAMNVGANAVEIMHKDLEINNRMEADIRSAFPDVPIILGGGTDVQSAKDRLRNADGALVGSCFENGKWGQGVDANTVKAYMAEVNSL